MSAWAVNMLWFWAGFVAWKVVFHAVKWAMTPLPRRPWRSAL